MVTYNFISLLKGRLRTNSLRSWWSNDKNTKQHRRLRGGHRGAPAKPTCRLGPSTSILLWWDAVSTLSSWDNVGRMNAWHSSSWDPSEMSWWANSKWREPGGGVGRTWNGRRTKDGKGGAPTFSLFRQLSILSLSLNVSVLRPNDKRKHHEGKHPLT